MPKKYYIPTGCYLIYWYKKKLSIKLGIYLSDIIAAANETPETELKFGS